MSSSFIDHVLSSRDRESLMSTCPALAFLCYQCVVAGHCTSTRVVDPLSGEMTDAVSDLLSAASVSDITRYIFSSEESDASSRTSFWRALRSALESVSAPCDQPGHVLCATNGISRVRVGGREPLAPASLLNALRASRLSLRSATACALAGSLRPLGPGAARPLAAMLRFARLVPAAEERAEGDRAEGDRAEGDRAEATAEGLGFAMQSLPQQWWTLVSVALERALALAGEGTSRGELWQLLAILFALDAGEAAFPFPARAEDLVVFHLLARLAETGLVYPLLVNGARCFALSPHFRHALLWGVPTPLCAAAMLYEDNDGSDGTREGEAKKNGENKQKTTEGDTNVKGLLRREDEDTIITETNFRLYAYTRNPDLLNILDQFAVREAEVEHMIVCFRVTRNSFAAALRKGINAAHILRFLSLRAHPSMQRHYCSTADSDDVERRKRRRCEGDVRAGLLIPQSFSDQLMAWESECQRLVFVRNLVLLRNISPAQRELISNYLTEKGERGAMVREDVGCLILRRDAYEKLIAPLIT